VSSLAAGTHAITAAYSGDALHAASASATLAQIVNGTATGATASSSRNPALVGDTVTFTAVVSAAGSVPGGSVQFYDGAATLGTAQLANGWASVSTSRLSAGEHWITATYAGGGGYGASSATITQTVLHAASLSWNASASTNVAGYNVYRASAHGGPYAKINAAPAPGLTYTDTSVISGQTYYYVCTAVDGANNESVYSNESVAAIP
jgi:large repetitive protein